jgi:long-chain acyl-CoA synthetase
MLNLATLLKESANRFPEETAVILDEFRLSYAELATLSRRVATVLRGKGVRRGDRVAMMVPNTPNFPIIYYAILQTGAIVVPVNVFFQKGEIEHYLRDSEAVAFFGSTLFAPQASAAFEATDSCKHFIQAGTLDWLETPEAGENLNHLLASASDDFDTVQTMPDDTAVILYTSGTTGAPKGAELSHFNMFFNALYSAEKIIKMQPGEVGLAVLPLFHSFGQTCIMNACLLTGSTMSMAIRFETEKILKMIERDGVTIMALVPTMYQFLLNAPGEYDLSSVRVAVSGGAALPGEVHRQFEERFGTSILEGYGLSETSPVASFSREGEPVRVGSIGKPIWGVDMAIMREDGSFAEVEEAGEVVIRGHNIMKGYYHRPEATAEAMAGGWFHTGDIGKIDEDGYYYIVDRKKDLIIRGGMNIYPREIEEVLYDHPKILEAAVVGVPDGIRGEEVKVFAAPKEGVPLEPEEISVFLQERIAKYKWPKQVEILDALPKGPTGKILKRELRG